MSRTVVRCHFCDWHETVRATDTSGRIALLHAAHLADHVDDMIRTALLPYDDDAFIPENPKPRPPHPLQ